MTNRSAFMYNPDAMGFKILHVFPGIVSGSLDNFDSAIDDCFAIFRMT